MPEGKGASMYQPSGAGARNLNNDNTNTYKMF